MRAATVRAYGLPSVVRVEEMPRPRQGPGEILVRVEAAPVTAGDARMRGMDVPSGFGPILRLVIGLRRPRRPVMGNEFAGTVEALGEGAEGFAPGDAVMGVTGLRGGAHAEWLAIKARGLVLPRPSTLSAEEGAAFFFGGLTAAAYLMDKGRLAAGESVLVNGATGAVGSAAVQIARHLGAHVTAVCGAANAALARELGAEAVIDHDAGPIRGTWDVILDVAGTLPLAVARPLLAPGGRLLLVTAGLWQTLGAGLRPRRGTLRLAAGPPPETREAMERLLAIHAAGGYRPLVGATFPLDAIAEAHALAGSRHKRGNAVVLMR